ncbi:hypothetical protein BD779DRAFT_1562613 [Infundibulicybe gibba]|nr:hypothetical protein BD779DRAFT_1562613 [Infundibulicybe gibba]
MRPRQQNGAPTPPLGSQTSCPPPVRVKLHVPYSCPPVACARRVGRIPPSTRVYIPTHTVHAPPSTRVHTSPPCTCIR